MPRPEANLFVVHSRFQVVVVQHMLQVLPELGARDSYLVLDMDGTDLPVMSRLWRGILQLQPPVGGRVLRKGVGCRRALREIDGIVAGYDRVDLLVSDIQWPLNNALYGRYARRGRATLTGFPDGIGSLQIVYPSTWQRAKDMAKAALGRFGGVPFVVFRGDVMGLELCTRIYSFLPEAIPALAPRLVRIPRLPTVGHRVTHNALLFVGQNYESFVPRARYLDIAASAARFAKSLGYPRLLYKPHPLENKSAASGVFRDYGFEIVTDARTVEEMFIDQQVACVVSYNSSALVHLKLLFGSAVRCVAVHNWDVLRHTNVEPRAREKMEAVLTLCGVELHT